MSQQIQTYSISAPGFFGLNTQDSPLDLAAGFALVATNCVIDQYGRIGSRKGWSRVNASSGALGANDIGVIHELVQSDGTLTVLFAGNNKLFKLDGSNAVSELTYGGGGTAPTITANNWQCTSLNGITYFFQSGFDPLIFDPTISTTTYRRVSEKTGYVATVPSGNIAISAYGRLWVASTATVKNTIYFSDLLSGHVWSTGTAGSLNVDRVWPNGADEITGLAAHNGFLIIFGKRQILVYANATTPATMTLSDTVGGIGCIARDTIQSTGKDILFLSNSGIRSFARTITEKSAPLGDLSKNVRNDLIDILTGETLSTVKSVYSEKEAFYLITLPLVKQVFCFDTKVELQDGSFRITTWDSIEPTALLSRRNGDLLIGKNGYVGKYGGYQDHTSAYRFQYYTNHADLGDQSVTSILKRLSIVVIGGTNQYVTMKWGFDFSYNYLSNNVLIPTQGVSEYGIAEYGANATTVAYYSDGVSLQTLTSSASGAGKVVQTGYETNINGSQLSVQKIEIQAKRGKVS
ncbi:hypothetical protein UFOVP1457_30 [uncultured Caudovirales phage]|uniref:Uncharacterized protein n=1 Tax=uncultured Caudovirales phage TaxID=2100421 RepID=A0A6J5SI91_9CAUD|nr:hypothetical protein UFOVP1457_30 [uncultured Caudovirales phage]